MPDRIRRARWLVAVALAVLVLCRAPAAGASEPLEDSVRIVPDTSGHKPHTPTSLSRLLAHADSVVKAQGGARADNAQLYLSWNAPWGSSARSRRASPRARTRR
jgi:hypothetical protein